MSEEPSEDADNLATNSEFARLAADGIDVDSVIALTGYVGEGPNQDVVRLYPGIDDLSVSVDVAKSDVLRTMKVPTSTMLAGAVAIWVLRTTEVTVRRTRTVSATAQQAIGFFGSWALNPTNAAPVTDRLNIQLRPRSERSVCWPCSATCWSQCTMNCSIRPPR